MSKYEDLIAATRQAATFYESVSEFNNADRLARLADALEESEREREKEARRADLWRNATVRANEEANRDAEDAEGEIAAVRAERNEALAVLAKVRAEVESWNIDRSRDAGEVIWGGAKYEVLSILDAAPVAAELTSDPCEFEDAEPSGLDKVVAGLADKGVIAAEAGEREVLRNALGGVLTNVSNYPRQAWAALWGGDLSKLIEKATDAALAARRAPIEDAEVIVQDTVFKRSELPEVLDRCMTAEQEAQREAKRWFMELESLKELMVELKPAEDAEPVAYEVRDKRTGKFRSYLSAGTIDEAIRREDFNLIPLYRAPQPAEPIEVTDEMVEAAVEAFKNPRRMVTNTSDGNMSDRMEAAIEAALKEMEKNR